MSKLKKVVLTICLILMFPIALAVPVFTIGSRDKISVANALSPHRNLQGDDIVTDNSPIAKKKKAKTASPAITGKDLPNRNPSVDVELDVEAFGATELTFAAVPIANNGLALATLELNSDPINATVSTDKKIFDEEFALLGLLDDFDQPISLPVEVPAEENINIAPLPSAFLLLASGLLGVIGIRRRIRK